MASVQVLQGIQSMTDTVSQVLEKQRLLEDRVSAGAEKAGAAAPADDVAGLAAEIQSIKKEQATWQKDIERAVQVTTDALGENSPFVSMQKFEQNTADILQKISDFQKDLNEGAGFTPRNIPIEESVRRSQVFDPQNAVRSSSEQTPEYEAKLKDLSAKVSELQAELSTQIKGVTGAQEKLKSDSDTIKGSLELIEGRVTAVEAGLLSGGRLVAPDWEAAVPFTLTLDADFASIGNQHVYKTELITDIAVASNTPQAFFKFVGLQAGSIINEMLVAPGSPDGVNPDNIIQGLIEQLNDPNSRLMQGKWTSKSMSIVPGAKPGGGVLGSAEKSDLQISGQTPEYEAKMKDLSAKVSELSTQIKGVTGAQEKLKSDSDTIKGSLELIEGRVTAVEAGLLSGGASQPGSAEKSDLQMEIMQQYQVAIGNANERIKDNQAAINELKSAQETWNRKLEQTLEVANEAFGQNTPFAMKGQVEHLEADHQHLQSELQAVRDTVAQLDSTARAAAVSSDKANARSAASAAEPGSEDNAKASPEAAAMELRQLNAEIAEEKKAREELRERLAALEPMRDEFVAEKMHTDSELNSLKQQCEELAANQQKEMEATKKLHEMVDSKTRSLESAVSGSADAHAKPAETANPSSGAEKSTSLIQDELKALEKSLAQQCEKLSVLETKVDSKAMEEQKDLLDKKIKEGLEAHSGDVAAESKALHSELKDLKDTMMQTLNSHDEVLEKKIKEGLEAHGGDAAAESKALHSELKDLKDTLMQTLNSHDEVLEKKIKEGLEAHGGDAAADSAAKAEMAKRIDSLQEDVKCLKEGVAKQQTEHQSMESSIQAAIARQDALQESTKKQESDFIKREEDMTAMKAAMKKSDEERAEDAKARR